MESKKIFNFIETQFVVFSKQAWWLASLQTSFGVRSSRIHFSPTDRPWGKNDCVTNEPQRKSSGRLLDDLFCTPLTAVINFESRNFFLLFLWAIKPDTQDYYSFLKFSQLVFSSLVGLVWLGELKPQWERILLLKTMFYTFSSNKIGK